MLAGLGVALLVVSAVAIAGRSIDHSADGGGRSSAPLSHASAEQSRRPSLEAPLARPGPTLPGAGNWVLYGRGDAEVVRLDLGSGPMTRTPVPQLATDGPVSFLATRTGVLVRPVQAEPGYQVPDGQPAGPLPAALGEGGLILPGPEPDQVWITSTSRYSTNDEMLLASLRAGWVRVQSGLPPDRSWPVRPDGAGSYFFDSTGGSYLRVPGGYRRITTGTVLAATAQSWLTAECDHRLRCHHLLLDRRSGARREVRLVPSFAAVVTLVSVSPDSRYAAVAYRLGTQAPALHVINLRNGVDHEVAAQLGPGLSESSVVWSPNGNYLAAVGNRGEMVVVRSATAENVELNADLPPVVQLATKPRRS